MYFIHRNNKAHSIYKLRETFAEEQSETANLKVSAKLKILVQSFQQKFIILCRKTVSRNLPKPPLNLPNRHKKSNWPKKAKRSQIWPFSKSRKNQRS